MKEQGNIVGRAELKLAGAAKAFGYDFRGKVVMDIGSSTGGFTEYALRCGAQKVVAIEKGTNQMKAPLRYDKRVELHEKTDFLEIGTPRKEMSKTAEDVLSTAEDTINKSFTIDSNKKNIVEQRENQVELVKPVQVDTVLADVSFLSLRKILQHARQVISRRADYLVMLKPQFEARPDQLVKGVVKNERMRREIIQDFERWLGRNGFVILKKRDNELTGKIGGNRERFYWLRVGK